jgi:thiol-disulfide isomerase/thioredoxin
MNRGRHLFVVVCAAGLVAAPVVSAAPPPAAHALLINGGDRPEANYLSHLHHLEDMVEVLRGRGVAPERIHVFSGDGADPAADLATREPPPPGFWILDGTRLGRRLKPQTRLVDTRWPGVALRPARRQALREWFETAGARIPPGDRLLVFVTDHGTGDEGDPEKGAISLWGESLTVGELRGLLSALPAGVETVMVMSQCYSGAFARVMSEPGAREPSGEVCGFFSTTAARKAYGCYPEGRDRDQVGHAFHFIEALRRRQTTSEAHRDVLAEDDTPDVPLRTSDAYLERVLDAEAAARGGGRDAVADTLLARAWRHRAAWEPELRLLDRIGTAFGTFSPRSLAEIAARENEIEGLHKAMATYAESWTDARVALAEALAADLLAAQPDWRARVEPGAFDALAVAERARTLEGLLERLLEHARGQPEAAGKLDTFRDRARRAAEAGWRLEVRKAALQRMRIILTGIAARELLREAGRAAQQRALAALDRCEAFSPGELAATATAAAAPPAPFPPLAEELATLEQVSPSWLGVRFRALPEKARAERGLPAGATLLQAIYPGSPAERAGLEPGDVVLGEPGRPFEAARQLREWTLTAPRGVPLRLSFLRPGDVPDGDRRFEATLTLRTVPVDLPRLPDPPRVGEKAPALPPALRPVAATALPEVAGRSHLLFFWATWCGPCKKAVPEVLALSAARGWPVLAISDEDAETVAQFLEQRTEPFLPGVAVDPMRQSFMAYGVSGTPTLLLVDAEGRIRHRQVGYRAEQGLTVEGWTWSAR